MHEAADDDDLVHRAQRGDEGAFTALYRRLEGPIYRFALRMGGSGALAEDVVQESFLALLGGKARFDPARGTLRSFLFGVARNQLGKRVREERAGSRAAGGGGPVEPAGAASERVRAVREALARLELRFREVVILCELEGLSYEEAAAALDAPVGTVRSRLHRARAELIALLRDEAPAGARPPALGETRYEGSEGRR
jgi:RNA polymerase sigma-70 factor (ECF subfamily)